jgi:hypothetical protein
LSKGRQDLLFKKLKDALVPVKPRDGDPTRRVQDLPFFRMSLEIGSIVGERRKTQELEPLVDAPVYLASHLAVAWPYEPEPWQAPL